MSRPLGDSATEYTQDLELRGPVTLVWLTVSQIRIRVSPAPETSLVPSRENTIEFTLLECPVSPINFEGIDEKFSGLTGYVDVNVDESMLGGLSLKIRLVSAFIVDRPLSWESDLRSISYAGKAERVQRVKAHPILTWRASVYSLVCDLLSPPSAAQSCGLGELPLADGLTESSKWCLPLVPESPRIIERKRSLKTFKPWVCDCTGMVDNEEFAWVRLLSTREYGGGGTESTSQIILLWRVCEPEEHSTYRQNPWSKLEKGVSCYSGFKIVDWIRGHSIRAIKYWSIQKNYLPWSSGI